MPDAQSRSRSHTPPQPFPRPHHSDSPVLSVSPPHEVKVRQISQGVEDIKWQQQASTCVEPGSWQDAGLGSQPDVDIAPTRDPEEVQGRIDGPQSQSRFESQFESQSQTETQTQTQSQMPVPPPPPCSFVSVDEVTEEAEEAQDAASSLPRTRRTSDSDSGEPEKGLKRKLGDRATSLGPERMATPTTETAKRPRDDADKDDNPRVLKRPSPPPEQNESSSSAPVPTPETPSPKLVRMFFVYASVPLVNAS